jgi:D-glycero-D-manno-heptose 1,7-bisphosphate phosphatase
LSPEPRACVFLDRDGTLIEDVGYAHRPEQLALLPGVPEGLAALRGAGFLLIVVTNQSGVARGFFGEADVRAFHAELSTRLGEPAAPDAYYYCPFHPDAAVESYRADSPLRKPAIGMFELACAEFAIARSASFMLGDKALDVEFGRRAGLRSILLAEAAAAPLGRHLVKPDFASAVDSILAFRIGVRNDWNW